MRDRIMGEEIEWVGGYRTKPENSWSDAGDVFSKVIEALCLEYKYFSISNNDSFLPNGAKIYFESSGKHIETASPECSGALEMLKFDKWSETVICKIAKNLKETVGELVFYKKNTDNNLLHTRGCHENYLSGRILGRLITESESRFRNQTPTFLSVHPEINYFILFLITRQIFTGSGGVMLYSLQNGTDIYEISPRTKFIDDILSGNTTGGGSRAIINTRNEPLASSDEFWRIHLILGDANMADLSIFLKFGTTSAIIEMIEEGFWNEDLCLEEPTKAPNILRNISKDLTLKNVPIRLKNGATYTALQIQKKFCENWRRYLRYTHQGGEKAEVAQRWKETLDRLEIDDEGLYSQLDWKIKMRLIWDFINKKSIPLNHKSIVNIDNLYHSPDREISFYYKLKNRPGSKIESLISESEILKAERVPPETRAKLRVYFKKFFSKLYLPHCASWEHVTFKINASEACEHKIHMPDPRLSSVTSLNLPINAEAIKYLNALKPNAIII